MLDNQKFLPKQSPKWLSIPVLPRNKLFGSLPAKVQTVSTRGLFCFREHIWDFKFTLYKPEFYRSGLGFSWEYTLLQDL